MNSKASKMCRRTITYSLNTTFCSLDDNITQEKVKIATRMSAQNDDFFLKFSVFGKNHSESSENLKNFRGSSKESTGVILDFQEIFPINGLPINGIQL